jgi:rubrerythrin
MTVTETGFEQIRTEQPVQNTIHNLIQTLSTKLDSAARYGLYQEDARKDGYDDCAKVFATLAEREQESIRDLVTCLQKHIGEVRA